MGRNTLGQQLDFAQGRKEDRRVEKLQVLQKRKGEQVIAGIDVISTLLSTINLESTFNPLEYTKMV